MAEKKKDVAALVIGVGKPKDEGKDFEEEAPEEEGFPEEEGEELPPAEEEESEGGAYPEFSIPEGLDLSDIEPGEEKEVLCLISKTSDGSACIKQVDGVDLAGLGQGMYGPPPAEPLPEELPPGPGGPPPPGMLAGGPPMELPPGMAIMGGPPPEEEMSPVRRRAAAAGLM